MNQTKINIGHGGSLSIENCSFARIQGLYPSLQVSGSSATIRIVDSHFEDEQAGVLLDISADRSTLALSSVTVQSAAPRKTEIIRDVLAQVVGIRLALDDTRATLTAARIQWCGQGGIAFAGANSRLSIHHSQLVGNHAWESGGALSVRGPGNAVELVGCTVRGGLADYDGGGIALEGDDCSLLLRGSSLLRNQAGNYGGLVAFRGARGRLALEGCNVSDNLVYSADGGAVFMDSGNGTLAVVGSALTGNICIGMGGALAVSTGEVLLSRSRFASNNAATGGGAAVDAPNASIAGCNFTGNTARAADGGALHFTHDGDGVALLYVGASLFRSNSAVNGGAIAIFATCAVSVVNSSLTSNVAQRAGGGLFLVGAGAGTGLDYARFDVHRTTIEGNTALDGAGGGLSLVGGAMNISATTFRENTAVVGGGGIAVSGSPSGPGMQGWVIEGSTFAGNEALVDGSGGAILLANLSMVRRLVGQGGGLPFAFTPSGDVGCRGTGDIRDLRVLAFDAANGSTTVPWLRDGNADQAGMFNLSNPLGLIVAVSLDASI